MNKTKGRAGSVVENNFWAQLQFIIRVSSEAHGDHPLTISNMRSLSTLYKYPGYDFNDQPPGRTYLFTARLFNR